MTTKNDIYSNINPGIKNENVVYSETVDPWQNRKLKMKCYSCVYYVAKKVPDEVNGIELGRCRRNAPTMKGYPVVYPYDWCGDHRMDENKLLCE